MLECSKSSKPCSIKTEGRGNMTGYGKRTSKDDQASFVAVESGSSPDHSASYSRKKRFLTKFWERLRERGKEKVILSSNF
jgi:hypothetical protein